MARADEPRIAIPAEPLDRALTDLARQSGLDIVSTEAGLGRVRAAGVTGRMAPREALRRLLKGTGFRGVAIDAHSYRIERMPRTPFARRIVARPAPPPTPGGDIIVTASKQRSTLLRFPGSAIMIGGFAPGGLTTRPLTIDDVARGTPVLQNTELGTGRNKIFIRGIADSSFNGATQSTASLYFDEVPLGFSGPEPSLNLYDMKRVEVLEGPQGTLYGSGAIGGIIRLTPNPVDLSRVGASVSSGVTATQGGAAGFDVAGMANLPVLRDRVGLRLIGYRDRDGGFIGDRLRRLSNVNRTDTLGGRATLAIDPGDGWSVELGAVQQHITAADAQYAERIVAALDRRARLAQPYSSDLTLLRGVVRKHWDSGLELISASGYVDLQTADVFDATRAIGSTGPTVYTNAQSASLFVQETRLSRAVPGKVSWLLGVAFLHNRDIQARTFGPPNQPLDIIGVTNMTDSLSAFGEATLPATDRLSVTVGARVTAARTDGEPSSRPRNDSFIRGRATRRVDPTLALSWLIAKRTALFARFQSGYRTGGLAVAAGIGRVADFRSDSILVGEVGLRKQRSGETGLELSAALSYARWRDIQADLYNRRGQPYTANIGNAEIAGIEATGDWVPLRGLHANFAFLYSYNVVDGPIAQSSVRENRRLPETPAFSGNAGLTYRWAHRGGSEFSIGLSGRYVGRSVLGTGDFLDVSQGKYAVLDAQLGWHWRNIDVSLSGDNLANASANRFALGNPTILATRQQTTPLRPRNVRLGFTVGL
ncbi:TonB-dependent receptor domain-containing protein [Sphingomonas sp. MMS24-J45]|uniref:TonB-dependent receptor domain-containing protein n=1 Tax=Sphingomonas sp. MMS24-J45 TaxID=3238806 RepID=UPI00384CB8FA